MEYDAAKERLMFLIDPNLPVNEEKDYDPGEERWDKQKKLTAFKKRISSGDQMPALFTETTLQAKVLSALNEWRSKVESKPPQEPKETTGAPAPEVDEDLEEEIRQYRQKADALHATLPVAGFVTQLKVPIDIEDIYVPLLAVLDLRGLAGECFADATQTETDCGLLLKASVLGDRNKVVEQYAFTQLQLGGNIDRSWIDRGASADKPGSGSIISPEKNMGGTHVNSGWVADFLPSGFRKTMEIQRPMRDKHAPVTQIVYSDGLSAISIFIESNDEDEDDVEGLSSRGAVNLYHKVVGNHLLTVVSEVPPRTLMQVFHSHTLQRKLTMLETLAIVVQVDGRYAFVKASQGNGCGQYRVVLHKNHPE